MIAKGPDRNSYYHEFFLRGKPELVKLMKRPTKMRRPQNSEATEPDFYRIAEISPLPEQKYENESDDETSPTKYFAKEEPDNRIGIPSSPEVEEWRSHNLRHRLPPPERTTLPYSQHPSNNQVALSPPTESSHQVSPTLAPFAAPGAPFVPSLVPSSSQVHPPSTWSYPAPAPPSPTLYPNFEHQDIVHSQTIVSPESCTSNGMNPAPDNQWVDDLLEHVDSLPEFEDPFLMDICPSDFW